MPFYFFKPFEIALRKAQTRNFLNFLNFLMVNPFL